MQPLPLSLKVPALGLPLFPGSSSPTVTRVTVQRAQPGFPRQVARGALPIAIDMIISEQQALLAARYVEPPVAWTHHAYPAVPPELMREIILIVESTPEMRPDRVEEAKERLSTGVPGSEQIAEKIIARAICEGLR